ncbi:hypothetical protein EV1_020795 [Malus domestica]
MCLFTNLILESDSFQIVAALKESSISINLSTVRPIVKDVISMMAMITRVHPFHVRCQANTIAHQLAQYALHSGCFCCWFKDPPDLIYDLLIEY